MTPSTAVVIPNWNGLDFIGPCLESVLAQSVSPLVIVVDNGSIDGSIEFIEKEFPRVALIKLDKNYGFTGGVNRGIEKALSGGAEYIALFNNDAVADPHWLQHLLKTATDFPAAGIVTSKILHMDKKKLDSTGDFYTTWGLPFPRGRDELDTGQYDGEESQVVFGASGGASLYRAAMLKKIGLFDDRFFAYYEDVDISFRAQLAGYKIRYTPEARVFHRIGGTSSKIGSFTRYHSSKNFVLLFTKDMPGSLFYKNLPFFILSALLMLLSGLKKGIFLTTLKGLLKGTQLAVIGIPIRRRVQRSRTVPISYISSILYPGLPPSKQGIFRLINKHLYKH